MMQNNFFRYFIISAVLVFTLAGVAGLSSAALAAGAVQQQPTAPTEGSTITVVFSDTVEGDIGLRQPTEMQVIVPPGAVDGDITVYSDHGISNGAFFELGTAQTPLDRGWAFTASGEITNDTVWNQNVLVTGDIEIASDVTLTINPGVTVYFAKGDSQHSGKWTDKTEITVFGTLIAEGSKSTPIYFTSASSDPSPGDWGGIVIRRGSTASVLDFTVIQYAIYGFSFWRPDKVSGNYTSSATLNHSVLQFNDYGVANVARAGYPGGGSSEVTATILNNWIRRSTYAGIYIRLGTGYGTGNDTSLIQNNLIEANDTGIHLFGGSWWEGHVDVKPEVRNNTIRNNASCGLEIRANGSSDISGSDSDVQPVIENNLLQNPGSTNICLLLDPQGSDGLQILSPVIRYNTITDAATGILVEDTEGHDTLNPVIDHNIFYGFDAYAIDNQTSRSITAEQNYWGSTGAEWDAGAGGMVNGTVNTANHLTSTSEPVLTRLSQGEAQIGTSVDIYGANFAFPGVIFPDNLTVAPFSADLIQLAAIVPPGAVAGEVFVNADGGDSNGLAFTPVVAAPMTTVSGTISTNTVWDQDLLIVGDITIESGVTLTITPGVTVYFAEGDNQASGNWTDKAEMIVFGTLFAEGTYELPIYFISNSAVPTAGDWGGIGIREDSTTSSLKYTVIQHATRGLHFWRPSTTGGTRTFSVTLSNSVLQFNEYGFFNAAAANYSPSIPIGSSTITAYLHNNQIRYNTHNGIHIQMSTGFGTGNDFSVIENNIIEGNDIGVFLRGNSWWDGSVDVKSEIRNNTIRNNATHGMDIRAYGSGDSSGSDTDVQPIIEHNLFQNPGGIDIHLYLHPDGSDGLQILSPVIRYNTIADANLGIVIEDTEAYDTLNPVIDHNIFYGFDEYAIHNLTDRLIIVDQNYWGNNEAEWDLGADDWITGTITSTNDLGSTSDPLLTHLSPGVGQPEDMIQIYGANFGNPYQVFVPVVARPQE